MVYQMAAGSATLQYLLKVHLLKYDLQYGRYFPTK